MGLDLDDPQQLFDLEFFKDNPQPFYQFAHHLYPSGILPSRTHDFIARLEAEKKLRRIYTQNIDNLEAAAGVTKVVACHGSLATLSCTGKCKGNIPAQQVLKEIENQKVPHCQICNGVLKPNVTFFGEDLPKDVKRLINQDRDKTDLLIIMGTSLNVRPMSHLVNFFPPHVPQILINLTPILPLKNLSSGFDVSLLGPCDDIIDQLQRSLGWQHDVKASSSTSSSSSASSSATPLLPWTSASCCGRQWVLGESGVELNHEATDDYVEIIKCDMCESIVNVNAGYSCKVCFDFDLCKSCYNKGKNPHVKSTKHKFSKI